MDPRLKYKLEKAYYFQLGVCGMFLQYMIAAPNLTLLIRLIRHDCHVKVVLFCVSFLSLGHTRILLVYNNILSETVSKHADYLMQ
jgi:hypothetical protein